MIMRLSKKSIFSLFICASLNMTLAFSVLADPPRDEPRPREPQRGRQMPEPGHGHFDPRGRYVPHPGYVAHFHQPGSWRPSWSIGFRFAPFYPIADVPAGYWQCIAFNPQGIAFPDYG